MAHTSCMLDKQGYMHSRSYTHKHVTFFAFPLQQLFANVRHCYVIRTLPILIVVITPTHDCACVGVITTIIYENARNITH